MSQVNGWAGESFASPGEQRGRIVGAYARDGLELLETTNELDVSSGKPLAERAGVRRAVEAIEAGRADVVVAAYFDRLVRCVRVQDKLGIKGPQERRARSCSTRSSARVPYCRVAVR